MPRAAHLDAAYASRLFHCLCDWLERRGVIRFPGISDSLRPLAVLLGLAIAFTHHAFAQSLDADESAPILTINYENDALSRQDGGYTSGFRMTASMPSQAPAQLQTLAGWLAPFDHRRPVSWSVTTSQLMFTPQDISEPRFPPEDRAYAGWLQAGLALFQLSGPLRQRFRLAVGVVGPSSGAEQVQKQVHQAIGANEPRGWEMQLKDEPTLQLAWDFQRRFVWRTGELVTEVAPGLGLALGNGLTGSEVNGYLRVGNRPSDGFDPARLRSVTGGDEFHRPGARGGWSVFIGAAGQYLWHDISLDGSLIREDELAVPREDARGQFYIGGAWFVGRTRLSLCTVAETADLEQADTLRRYSAFSVSWPI